METNGRLSIIISSRLENHKQMLAEQQDLLDSAMKELLGQRERFTAVATQIMQSAILPRMKELLRYFDNSSMTEYHGDADFILSCQFAHTPRFPATVSLAISLLPGESTNLTVRYNLDIFPVLMEFKHDDEKSFSCEGSEDEICLWVEDRIVEFVDTYLRLETHPLYQKDNLVIDIVCGMRIPLVAAICSVQRDDRTFYFCSDHCKEAFIKKNS